MADAGEAGGTGGSGGQPLACDPRFSFSAQPVAGVTFDVRFTDTPGYTYVDMQVSGPGTPSASWVGVTGDSPHTWDWAVQGHEAGVLSLTFMKDTNTPPGQAVANCQKLVASGGTGGTGGTGGAGGGPPTNRYGIGYTNQGSAGDHDLTAKLAGPGGWVLVIFADVRPDRHTADPSWKQSIADAYARDLIPVIRMAPPWGDRRVRNMGESPTSYKALGQAYRDIIADLPRRAGWPLYVEAHNEPNLCYEWACGFTVKAYQNVWLTNPSILGVTPFMLRDPSWDQFAWVDAGGNPYPVYTSVRAYRCAQPGAANCL